MVVILPALHLFLQTTEGSMVVILPALHLFLQTTEGSMHLKKDDFHLS